MGSKKKMLYVASTGGHLTQLVRIAGDPESDGDSVWVTFDSPQSRSLLAGRRTLYVPYVAPRDVKGVIRASHRMWSKLGTEQFDGVITTGAAIALAAVPWALKRRVPVKYIESVSRVNGPSLTGRILYHSRMADMWSQHPSWAGGRWQVTSSVLDTYSIGERPRVSEPRLLVTLGTIRPYRFDALVDAVLGTGLVDDSTTWQLGATKRTDLPGQVFEQLEHAELVKAIDAADAVISHSGVGSALDLLSHGKLPILVPRARDRGEHVDDHQVQIAELLGARGLAVVATPETLTAEIIRASTRYFVS